MDRFRDPAELVEILGDWMRDPGPMYRKLAAALERAIRAGDLDAGERLPSERGLARALAVSRATVVSAYDELRARGATDSRQGSGTTVSRRIDPSSRPDGRVVNGQATSIFQRLVDGPGELISLARAVDVAIPELADVLQDLADEDLPELLSDVGYHPHGLPRLRDAIAAHYREHSLPTTPDQVLVTTGAHQAIGLVTQMYLRKGATVVVESPSWPGCLDVFRAAGARLVGVPLDDEGIEVDGLARALAEHEPALLYVMPTYHNPTGTLMSAARRRRVAELAGRRGVLVLEDNAYLAQPDPGGGSDPPPPLAACAPAGTDVLTVGTLAKLVWGGLRIGWVRAPTGIAERLARLKALADLGSPVLDQALAARLLPDLAELAAERAQRVGRRLDYLGGLLAEQLPSWSWRQPDGGSALWIRLPETDARVFAQVALRNGVEVVPGATMDCTGTHDDHIRIPCTFSEEVLAELVDRLRRSWHELQRHGPAPDVPLHPIV